MPRIAGGRRFPPIALALLVAPVAGLLGVMGYDRAYPELSWSDVAYRALQLFALDAQVPADGTPWQLDVARFAAPLAVVYAAVLAAVALLRTRYDAWRVRLRARDHVVVVGLGDAGVRIVRGLREGEGHRVVVVELDPGNPYFAAARSYGARVVVGDATSPALLDRVRVDRARHIVVASGDDSLNLEVVAAVRTAVGARRVQLGVHVLLAHLGLWQELNRVRPLVVDTLNVEHVHLPDRAALRLLDRLDTIVGTGRRRVLLEGDDPLAARAATHLARRALAGGEPPALRLGPDLRARLAVDEPWLESHLSPADQPPDVVVVCSGAAGDAAGIARGLRLAALHPLAEVVVTVEHESGSDLLEVTSSHGRRVRLVPPRIDELGRELFEHSAVEVIARARHAGYVAEQEAAGVTPDENPSLTSWEALPASLQLSNRRYAESMATVLGTLGGELIPLTGPPVKDPMWDPDLLEALARQEHQRWCDDLKADGWSQSDGPKDAEGKRHPLLVDWEELLEPDREKDRQSVRDLPSMLARLGYALALNLPGDGAWEPPP